VIPYRADDADDPTQAIPVVTFGLIVVNFLVFLYELALGAQGSQLDNFLNAYSLVPCEYAGRCAAYAGTPSPFWLTLFSSMFLHAGWAHILGNMLFLYVFGIHVERSMGPIRYLLFYLICGLGANALEIVTSLGSNLPGLGASGAISGVLAGYLLLYPGSHVRTLIPLGFFFWIARIPAWVFIGLWFLLQLADGLMTISSASSGGVAYSAHVGGFLTGLVLVRLFSQTHRVDRMRVYHGSGFMDRRA
jgi:membrane associated rhomboid family serine protease